MTHLNIQQGLNIEVVSTNLIKKLYEAALSVPEPLEGELDAAYMSGNLLVDKSYRTLVEYLTNRFDDLHINVTDNYYISFEDSAVLNVLLANNFSADGIGVTEADAANATFTNSTFKNNTTITSFNEFPYFTKANINPPQDLFRGCSNLEEINLSSVINISLYEFASSGIKEINAQSLQTIGEYGFAYSKVENIIDLGQVIEIPLSAFQECSNLVSAIIPETVTSLGNSSFTAYNTSYSKVFTTITGLNTVQNFGSSCFNSLVNLNLNGSDISSAVSIKADAFSNCKLFSGNLNLKNLLILEHDAFRNTKISKILCLGKISSIPAYAFVSDTSYDFKSSLTEAYLPYECLSIEILAFYYRTGLTTLKQYTLSVDDWIEGETPTYGDITRVTSFGNSCFNNCSNLNIPASALLNATSIGNSAFYGCSSLTGTLNLPSLISLGNAAFQNTKITSVTDLGRISLIPNNCFLNCTSLTSVTLPSTCKTIAGQAFDGCTALTSINLDNIESISGYYAFRNTGITDYVLPKIKNFGARNLSTCNNAYLLDCGSDLTTIASDALWDSGFSIFIFRGTTPPSFSGTNFEYNMTGRIIYVPDAAVTDYQTAWPNMASYITGLSNYNPS